MATEDVKVTAMNMYKYKERLRLCKRWPCSTYTLKQDSFPFTVLACGKFTPPVAVYGSKTSRALINLLFTQNVPMSIDIST